MEKSKNKSRSIINSILMIFSIFVVIVLVPLVFINGSKAVEYFISIGIQNSPNNNDGYVIAEFIDPADDLLLPLPSDSVYRNIRTALDIRKFSVKKVKFNSLSGNGIDSRLNVCIEFGGDQPNPFDFKNKFSFPVMHVYLLTPDAKTVDNISNKTATVKFGRNSWNYQVIIDGTHEQARVFDGDGKFLFNGLGLYVNYESKTDPDSKKQIITNTKITAGLPLDRIGDPAEGRWEYYALTGLLDVKNPSMLYQSNINSLNVFDIVMPDTSSTTEISFAIQPKLSPLIVEYKKKFRTNE